MLERSLGSKWENLCSAKNTFVEHIRQAQPHFSVVVCGSSVYGVRNGAVLSDSNLSDIDTVVLIPKPIPYGDLQKDLNSILDTFEQPSEEAYQQFSGGEINILRIGGV